MTVPRAVVYKGVDGKIYIFNTTTDEKTYKSEAITLEKVKKNTVTGFSLRITPEKKFVQFFALALDAVIVTISGKKYSVLADPAKPLNEMFVLGLDQASASLLSDFIGGALKIEDDEQKEQITQVVKVSVVCFWSGC